MARGPPEEAVCLLAQRIASNWRKKNMVTRISAAFACSVMSLIVVVTYTSSAGAYSYVVTNSPVTYIPDDYFYYTATRWEESYATASTSSGGASCNAETFARGSSGGDASVNTMTIGATTREWEWDGPAGTAPGGSLFWYYAGDGYSQASAVNTLIDEDRNIYSSGNVSSQAFGISSVYYDGTNCYGSGTATGMVTDGEVGTGDAYYQGVAVYYDENGDPVYDAHEIEEFKQGSSDTIVVWNAYGEDTPIIPVGTGSFDITAWVECACTSTANNTTGVSESESSAQTTVVMYTLFTSN